MSQGRHRLVEAFRCLLDNHWATYCGGESNPQLQTACLRAMHLADMFAKPGSLTEYERAWLFFAVLVPRDSAREEWLRRFGLHGPELGRAPLMLTDAECAPVGDVIARFEAMFSRKHHLAAVLRFDLQAASESEQGMNRQAQREVLP